MKRCIVADQSNRAGKQPAFFIEAQDNIMNPHYIHLSSYIATRMHAESLLEATRAKRRRSKGKATLSYKELQDGNISSFPAL